MRSGGTPRKRRFVPRTAHETAGYLGRLALLLAVCDFVGAAIAASGVPWTWDLPTAIGTLAFAAAGIVFFFFLATVYGQQAVVDGASVNPRILEPIVRNRERELGEPMAAQAVWALLAGTLLLIALVFAASDVAGLVLSLGLVPVGGAVWADDRRRHPIRKADRRLP